jgi:hypothetical protein
LHHQLNINTLKKYLKEAVLWVLMAISFAYLAIIWDNLPEQIPIHFYSKGNPNGWSSKIGLIFITGGIEIGSYLLMLITPKRYIPIVQMGYNYYNLRLIIILFISIAMTFCIYMSHAGNMKISN